MPRMRMIKPELFDDFKLARCSRDARLLYMGLWTQADEWSRAMGDPRLIKGKIFPYDDDIDPAAITKLIDELADDAVGAIERYDAGGAPYLYLAKLVRHQYLDPEGTASRLPEPPGFDAERYLTQPNVKHRAGCPHSRNPNKSGAAPTLFGDDPDQLVPIQGTSNKGQVTGDRSNPSVVASDADPPARTRRGTRLPDDFAIPVDQRDWFAENCPHVDVRVEHQKFVNYWTSKSGQGATKVDWIRTWRNWMLTAEQDAPRNGRGGRGGYRPSLDDKITGLQALKDPEPDDGPDDDPPPNTIQGSVEP